MNPNTNYLHDLINAEIDRAGGREMMAHRIIAQSPEWYSPEEVAESRAIVKANKLPIHSRLTQSIPKPKLHNLNERQINESGNIKTRYIHQPRHSAA